MVKSKKVLAKLASGKVINAYDLVEITGFTLSRCRKSIHEFNRGERSEESLLRVKGAYSGAAVRRKTTLFAHTPLGALSVNNLYEMVGGQVSKGALAGRIRLYRDGKISFDQLTSRDRLPSGAGCKVGKGCVKEGFKVDVKGGRRSVNDLRKITELDRIYGMGE